MTDAEQVAGHPRRWTILGVLVLSLLVVVLDNTVLNVALRTIADPVHGVGASQAQLEWAINAYTLVFAGLLFTAGILGDRFGRRRLLFIGLAVFGLASLASAYSQTPNQLIIARGLMGLGAATVLPSTLSIISNVFSPRERGRAIGVWAGAVGLGVAIGPVVGGALLERFWWGSVFLINVPIVAVAIVLMAMLVPESRNPNPGRLDLTGVLLSVVGLVVLVFGIIYGGDHGFDLPVVWVALLVGLGLLAWFVRHERRSDHPSLDMGLFRDARFSAAVVAIALVFFAGFGTLFFLSFYLQLVRGFSPLQAGLLLTPFAVAQLIFAPLSSTMVRRFGPRVVSSTGLVLVMLSVAGYALLGIHTTLWLLVVLTFVQGVGLANVVPPSTESIMSTLPPERAGVGSAVSNTFRQVGGAMGVAILGAVISAVYRRQVAGSLSALPAPARGTAAESISGAYGVAPAAGPGVHAFLDAANRAFVVAMHRASVVAALIAAVGVGVGLAFLPNHSNPNAGQPGPPAAGKAAPPGPSRPPEAGRGATPARTGARSGEPARDRATARDRDGGPPGRTGDRRRTRSRTRAGKQGTSGT